MAYKLMGESDTSAVYCRIIKFCKTVFYNVKPHGSNYSLSHSVMPPQDLCYQ